MTKKRPAKKAPAKKRKRKGGRKRVDPRTTPDWIRWVIAARDMIMNSTIASAAAGISLSERQLKNWKKHEAWPDAMRAAELLCLQGIKHKAIRGVDAHVERNPVLGLEIMKLTMKELQPPKKHEHSGPGGKPIPFALTDAERATKAEELLNRARKRKAS